MPRGCSLQTRYCREPCRHRLLPSSAVDVQASFRGLAVHPRPRPVLSPQTEVRCLTRPVQTRGANFTGVRTNPPAPRSHHPHRVYHHQLDSESPAAPPRQLVTSEAAETDDRLTARPAHPWRRGPGAPAGLGRKKEAKREVRDSTATLDPHPIGRCIHPLLPAECHQSVYRYPPATRPWTPDRH